MERVESAAWPLAGGVLCAFVIAVLLKGVFWVVGFVAAGVAVAGWSLTAPPVVGASMGFAAWAFVTGFDVVGTGDLAVSGPWDAVRAAVLVGVGALAGTIGTVVRRIASSRTEPGPPPPEDFAVSDVDEVPVVDEAPEAEPSLDGRKKSTSNFLFASHDGAPEQ